MPKREEHTAILVFVRNEREESRAKRFTRVAGRRSDRRIARILNRRIERLASGTGMPTFVVSSEQQVGREFGDRFSNAIQHLFDRGFERVISVGNDCLTLRREALLEVEQKLATTSLVLGPTYDGGAYVIGIDRSIFQQAAFRNLPWQGAELFQALLAYGRNRGSNPTLMTPEWDADDAVSFAKALEALAEDHPLVLLLSPLLLKHHLQIWPSHRPTIQIFLKTPLLRGPPPAVLYGLS